MSIFLWVINFLWRKCQGCNPVIQWVCKRNPSQGFEFLSVPAERGGIFHSGAWTGAANHLPPPPPQKKKNSILPQILACAVLFSCAAWNSVVPAENPVLDWNWRETEYILKSFYIVIWRETESSFSGRETALDIFRVGPKIKWEKKKLRDSMKEKN